jgi:hypothetical protein
MVHALCFAFCSLLSGIRICIHDTDALSAVERTFDFQAVSIFLEIRLSNDKRFFVEEERQPGGSIRPPVSFANPADVP